MGAYSTIEVGYALGTTLVRGDFFKSWWTSEKFERHELVVRPDNPLGKSVRFTPTQMLIPPTEQMRHMDGYSHIGLFLPLAPLRNYVAYKGAGSQLEETDNGWKFGYWPAKIVAVHGTGVDVHRVHMRPGDSLLRHIQIGIARVRATCALRISISQTIKVLRNGNNPIARKAVLPAMLIALLSPSVLRNACNYFLDLPVLVFLRLIQKVLGIELGIQSRIWYLGLTRALSLRLKK